MKKNIFILIFAISSFTYPKNLGYIIKNNTIFYREEIEGSKKEYELPFINKESFEIIDDIGSDRKKLINFCHYMEALVAYRKYYAPDKE